MPGTSQSGATAIPNEFEKSYPQRRIDAEDAIVKNTSIAKIFAMIAAGARVLDVGCATGDLARLLSERGCEVVGLDSNGEALTIAAEYCSRTILADLDKQSLPSLLRGERFDVIVFADVLEHLKDPWSVFDSARTLFNDGGRAIVSLPNIAHGAVRLGLLDGTFDYRQYGILDNTHLRFFTRRSAEVLMIRAGYCLEQCERTTLPLFQPSELVGILDQHRISPELLAQIRADEEHETLQFILRAKPLEDSAKLEQLALAYATASTAESEVDEIRKQLLVTHQMLGEALADVSQLRAELSNEVSDAERLYRSRQDDALELAKQQLASMYDALVTLSSRYEQSREAYSKTARTLALTEHNLYVSLQNHVDDYHSLTACRSVQNRAMIAQIISMDDQLQRAAKRIRALESGHAETQSVQGLEQHS